jgi:hypothetical protein
MLFINNRYNRHWTMAMKLLKDLIEMTVYDQAPTDGEIEQEIADAKQAIKRAKEQGKAPMVAKYEMRLRNAQKKLAYAQKK